MPVKSFTKNKVQAKNKNIINIKINTEKKQKRRRYAKRSGSPKARGNHSLGYSMMPPIVINSQPPSMFPNYNPPSFVNNRNSIPEPIREETNTINQPIRQEQQIKQEEPIRVKTERVQYEPVHIKSEPISSFINSPNTTEIPLSSSIKIKKEKDEKYFDNRFINTPTTKSVGFAEELNQWHSPLVSTQLNSDDEVIEYKPPISSVKDIKIHPIDDDEFLTEKSSELKKREHSDNMNARYHSVVDDFDRKNPDHIRIYDDLIEQYNAINPDGKPDSEFAGKGPSKERYKKLVSRINRHKKNLEKANQNQEDNDVIFLKRLPSMKFNSKVYPDV